MVAFGAFAVLASIQIYTIIEINLWRDERLCSGLFEWAVLSVTIDTWSFLHSSFSSFALYQSGFCSRPRGFWPSLSPQVPKFNRSWLSPTLVSFAKKGPRGESFWILLFMIWRSFSLKSVFILSNLRVRCSKYTWISVSKRGAAPLDISSPCAPKRWITHRRDNYLFRLTWSST